MTTTNDRHSRAIARLIRDGHAATEDEAMDLLARMILKGWNADEVAVFSNKWLAIEVTQAKKGGAR